MKTLKEFIKEKGSQAESAHTIGISAATLNRILNGHNKASHLLEKRLLSLGVTISPTDIKGGESDEKIPGQPLL